MLLSQTAADRKLAASHSRTYCGLSARNARCSGISSSNDSTEIGGTEDLFSAIWKAQELITFDPIEKLDAPRIQRELPHVLRQEQINNLFRQVDVETPAGKRDFAMLHMLYATGMRVSELISLHLGDFDADGATIVCPGRNGRSKRERVLPLSSIVVEATNRYLETARPGLIKRHPKELALFLNHHGEPLTRQGFWLIIKGYARQAGITEITPHMLRHSFAILMLQEGMELRSVQELLGHAHISTTQVYNQLARESVATGV